ncbi:FAD-binding and (Fe-S)-binding domain-containing protein [Fulvivirga sedimenti]|uniref:FAD-binding protein n=1 Tax=Fulvivirga sedimenti TaxID=2879465 RepID=A0A9X1L123_9BACT|nr:FAD-binding and (Fe-S)-binding domain-containing protein [Fulvivirga sedimenti]MCA6075457.1 FAD-binding protein [Fulvivirga sedimenti]MCA6076634.1 FAD-binding protein [Fulvivirga sedimenti]MCA6077762.1 FAD-binding protein [Fulvivirga sedimenti]
MSITLESLGERLQGQLYYDDTMRKLYATDASAYRELPLAVAIPENAEDIRQLISYAIEAKTSLIPRTAGTSLAGQVVGNGIVVDVSKNFTKIVEHNSVEQWVRVQPGVIRDELNMYLESHGFLFGPETSTANRAMIGGMIGNNSCGSNSIVYGSTRDHLMEVHGFLSDGSEVVFGELTLDEFSEKCSLKTLEGEIYRQIRDMLSNPENRANIDSNYPKPTIHRRNTGYAIDMLKDLEPFIENGGKFNFCKLIAGSEGTLMFITEAKLRINPLPPPVSGLLCAHFESIHDALLGNLEAIRYEPYASELMDHYILECTKGNIQYRQNRFFLQGDPKAILVVELRGSTLEEVEKKAAGLVADLKAKNLGYHFPLVTGEDTKRVWSLRKAGLGLLSNIPGDAKPVPVIEDTAVDVQDLPAYIDEFNETLKKYNLFCVHYAHAGSGELHLRPILDLKTQEGNRMFRVILEEIAALVKKYKGSLSGEHGDGRLRGEFIPFMIGDANFALLKDIKAAWDPKNIFNPGKIVHTPAMNEQLRYTPGQLTPEFHTIFNFDTYHGIVRSAELCNGSGDCRKTHLSGGTMCPSYMATKNEMDTTRARANILREVLTNSKRENPFDSEEIKAVMDLCLSCKGCKSECPSNVDIGKMKAEWQYQYYKSHGIPFRTKMIAQFTSNNRKASKVAGLYNTFVAGGLTGKLAKSIMGIAPQRSMPKLHKVTLRKWAEKNLAQLQPKHPKRTVYLFCDEFTDYNDTPIGITAIKLLTELGYAVKMADHEESGRTFFSKGMLDEAKAIAVENVRLFSELISDKVPLIGIEPSAILSFRDEYPEIVGESLQARAKILAECSFMIDEFLAEEIAAGRIQSDQFTTEKARIRLHGHCHQKALSSVVPTKKILSLPVNYEVLMIPSGCCGMAGSFGYEKEHYDVSMQIGELVLFPAVRAEESTTIIAAPGTSCRHQIMDGTGRSAKHPVEVLYEALKK